MSDEPDDLESAPTAVSKPKKQKSRADELIDAVRGLKPDKVVWTCRNCGNNGYRVFMPLDAGDSLRICTKCKKRYAHASVRSRAPDALVSGGQSSLSSPIQGGQMLRGPFFGDPPPPENRDPNRPLHRSKTEKE